MEKTNPVKVSDVNPVHEQTIFQAIINEDEAFKVSLARIYTPKSKRVLYNHSVDIIYYFI